jgi:hypothetical protein
MLTFEHLDPDGQSLIAAAETRFADGVLAARTLDADFSGSLFYDRVAGAEYLIRRGRRDVEGRRSRQSLGRRSADTDKVLAEFNAARADLRARVATARRGDDAARRDLRGLDVAAVPLSVATLLRQLDRAGLLNGRLVVVSAAVFHAYEVAAKGRIDTGLGPDPDRRLVLFDREGDPAGLSALFAGLDGGYQPMPGTSQIIGANGLVVDVISPGGAKPILSEAASQADARTTAAEASAATLGWLAATEPMIGLGFEGGRPVHLPVPDPRAYAAYRLCRARETTLTPVERDAHRAQARAAGQVAAHMGLDPGGADLPTVPANLRAAVARLVEVG